MTGFYRLRIFFTGLILMAFCFQATSQNIITAGIGHNLQIESLSWNGKRVELPVPLPFFSVEINGEMYFSNQFQSHQESFVLKDLASVKLTRPETGASFTMQVTMQNISADTLVIENFVPLGRSESHPYITSTGVWNLARSKLFLPGRGPVGVILPDNAWELGYASTPVDAQYSVFALARRTAWDNARRRRYKTDVYPGGTISWTIWMEPFEGRWQNGLKTAFQQRWLYDLEAFDNTLFERPDLQWIRHDYLITLQMAWDHQYYDALTGHYHLDKFLEKGKQLMGGYDVYSIWPTWPRLGVDERNQWDLYEDLPGGLEKMRGLSQLCQDQGTKFFIAYNPWDRSTREEDPYQGMARLIEATHADGVVLDTRGSSSYELQRAADSVRSGVVMYSEGMAVPKDMPGIVAGRVHDAIYMPPPLNLNKLIKPDFGIFRVCQLSQGRISREANISLFNGYGVELNTYYPGRPDWIDDEYRYLGRIVKVLRENTEAFNSYDWTPLIPARTDSIWVNRFPASHKTIFTVYSLIPEGFDGPLFQAAIPEGFHAVSLWNHEMLTPDTIGNNILLPVKTAAFDRAWIGSRRESNVDVVAILPQLLHTGLVADTLIVHAATGDRIVVSAGNPTYQVRQIELPAGDHRLKTGDYFGRYEGKIVVQLFDQKNQLTDETVEVLTPGTSRLISQFAETEPAASAPEGMKLVTAGDFVFTASNPDQFIPYPGNSDGDTLHMHSFYMDEFPVTNAGFQRFMELTNYRPAYARNFLKHWQNGTYPKGKSNHPVVYVSLEDARAFCAARGTRLPTEAEWQYAAQGTDGRKWPWGNTFDSTRCNNALGQTTPVDSFPSGKSPFGISDLTGNVWQLTQDVYDDGSYYFVIIKGGSFYKPTSSWWYVQGGPQPAGHQQMLLLVSPGFDRNSTVGFRCVKDAKQ